MDLKPPKRVAVDVRMIHEISEMTAIPLHIQRRIEQRWASRFTQPDASNAPKNLGTKSDTINGSAPRSGA
jgi:hypothetical protein